MFLVDDIGKVDRETFEETWENCSQDKYYEYYDYDYNELEFENRFIQDLDQGKDDLETEVLIDTKDIEGKNTTKVADKEDAESETVLKHDESMKSSLVLDLKKELEQQIKEKN